MKHILIIIVAVTLGVGGWLWWSSSLEDKPRTGAQYLTTQPDDLSGNPSIIGEIMTYAGLETLAIAIEQAELVEVLSQAEAITIFAPSDEAFVALDSEVLGQLMQNENRQQLAEVLSYHVVPEIVTAEDLRSRESLTTLSGEDLSITLDENDNPFINEQRVLEADVPIVNGIIHVIDGLIQ